MDDENPTTTTTNPEATPQERDTLDLDVAELTRDRVRGNDGKFLSRASSRKAHEEQPTREPETQPQPEPEETKPQPEAEQKKEPEPEPVKSDKLRRVLELEAKAKEKLTTVEAREREVVQFYQAAKQTEKRLAERERALSEREGQWSAQGIMADPAGFILGLGVDPMQFLEGVAAGDGKPLRAPAPTQVPHARELQEMREELAALKREREAEREHLTMRQQQEQAAAAERWFVQEASDATRYPAIHEALLGDEEVILTKLRGIARGMRASGEALDDAEILGRLEATCRSKLDQRTSRQGQQGAKPQGQASGTRETSSRGPEPSLSSALSGQRAELPRHRPRADRLKDFDLGKFNLKD